MPNNEQQQPTQAVRGSYLRFLQAHRDGGAMRDMDDKLKELIDQVKATRRGGTVTMKVRVAPATKGGDLALVVEDEISVKLPARERIGSMFFADENGMLCRENPNQMRLELKTVKIVSADEEDSAPPKVVSA